MMYTNVKGYQIPNLSLPKAKKTNLNRYGRMRLDYLEQNEPNLCDQMMLEGTLLSSCRKMGLDAQQMVDKTLRDLMQKAQMPDRKTNPLPDGCRTREDACMDKQAGRIEAPAATHP